MTAPLEVWPVSFRGRAVRLTPLEGSHAPALCAAGADRRIWQWLPTRLETPAEFEAMVADALAARATGAEMPFVVLDPATGDVIGATRLMEIAPRDRRVEIGWTWYTPAVWRTRVNTECKYLLLRHAFEELGAVCVQLKTDLRNTRSQAAIERIGGHRDGVLRKHRILSDGYIRDTVYYSIIAEEWPSVRERLLGFLSR